MRIRSLRARIAAVYVTLMVVSLTLLALFLANQQAERTREALARGLRAQTLLAAAAARPVLDGSEREDLQAWAKRLGGLTGARVTVIAPDGVVLADSDEDPARMENHAGRPEVVAALAWGSGESLRHSATLGYDMLYFATLVRGAAGPLGVVRLAVPAGEVAAARNEVIRSAIVAALISCAGAVALAILVAHVSTRQIAAVTRASRALRSGQLAGPIAVRSTDEAGELAANFNAMVADLQRLLEAAAREHARMLAILAGMADGVVILDAQGRVTLLNPAGERLLGTTASAAEGCPLIEVARDHELAALAERALADPGHGELSAELRHLGKRTVRAIATRVGEGRDAQAVVVLQDLTEIRRLEAIRREFIANVSHELRTPIASLKALVDTLQEGAIDDREAAQHFLASMQVEVDGLAHLVQELLELARIESGQVPMRRERRDVAPVIAAAAERLRPQAERNHQTLTLALAPDLPPAMIDAARIEQVVINLVHNATKFTPPGGSIEVAASAADGRIWVSVRDNGEGIDPADLPRLFERFYKADRARSSGGTGLGLAIAKHVVQAHGGAIWAASEGPGRGATFTFTLPIFDAAPEP